MEKNIPVVGFQGEIGAYSEKAINLYFSKASSKAYKTFSDLFDALENEQIELAILPIENSIEGSVTESYELLLKSKITVVGEINVKIEHCLISHHDTSKDDIDVIYSHTQALGQCKAYLKNSGCDAVTTYDTAGSVKMIKEKNMKRAAAIASKDAAKLYDMSVIEENIQDHEDNFTRFFCLSKIPTKSTGNDKTSIVFSAGDVAGSLYKALKEFADGDINLTKLESRLTRKKAWEYNFYLDFEGHIDDENCKKAIQELVNLGSLVKILGSYPRSNDKL
ncbi:MAG: prephenate dehydratase [Nitrososphaerales archaeon]|nr:prephenate dehydratase [Nitrososphaerales archaeon]